MKLLLLGDLHFSLKSSSSRVDNIVEEFLYRFKDLQDKIAKNGIMAVICTGDIFNTPYQSPETIIMLSKEIESLGIPFITAIGTHWDLPRGKVTFQKPYSRAQRELSNCLACFLNNKINIFRLFLCQLRE